MKNWKAFNENFIKNAYNFIKLVKLLRGWEKKYQPSQYDEVIEKAFVLIDGYGLKPGKLSPSFTLPNVQLEEEFIKKFFEAAKSHGYDVFSKPHVPNRDGAYYPIDTTFNFAVKGTYTKPEPEEKPLDPTAPRHKYNI